MPAYPVAGDTRPALATRYPSDSAARTSPWFDLTVASFVWDERIGQFMNIGVQLGAYVSKRVRIAGRAFLPTEDSQDQFDQFNSDPFNVLDNDGWVYVNSEPATFLFGADLGIIAANTATFVLSPGLMFMRSDVSDYGTMVGLSLPFEWVTSTGLRVGFEFDVGRAFGGSVRQVCNPGSATVVTCTAGDIRTADRDPGTAFMLGFELGWGFNHPEPEPVK